MFLYGVNSFECISFAACIGRKLNFCLFNCHCYFGSLSLSSVTKGEVVCDSLAFTGRFEQCYFAQIVLTRWLVFALYS